MRKSTLCQVHVKACLLEAGEGWVIGCNWDSVSVLLVQHNAGSVIPVKCEKIKLPCIPGQSSLSPLTHKETRKEKQHWWEWIRSQDDAQEGRRACWQAGNAASALWLYLQSEWDRLLPPPEGVGIHTLWFVCLCWGCVCVCVCVRVCAYVCACVCACVYGKKAAETEGTRQSANVFVLICVRVTPCLSYQSGQSSMFLSAAAT